MPYGREYHKTHYFCFRHWLEALGSRGFVAMLPRRLLFTRPKAAYAGILLQTLSDFAEGCRAGQIMESGQIKFVSIFGSSFPAPSPWRGCMFCDFYNVYRSVRRLYFALLRVPEFGAGQGARSEW
jgi:hypothetical protein